MPIRPHRQQSHPALGGCWPKSMSDSTGLAQASRRRRRTAAAAAGGPGGSPGQFLASPGPLLLRPRGEPKSERCSQQFTLTKGLIAAPAAPAQPVSPSPLAVRGGPGLTAVRGWARRGPEGIRHLAPFCSPASGEGATPQQASEENCRIVGTVNTTNVSSLAQAAARVWRARPASMTGARQCMGSRCRRRLGTHEQKNGRLEQSSACLVG